MTPISYEETGAGRHTFDRLIAFDRKSRKFPVRKAARPVELKSVLWDCNVWLDQGREGACVGYSISHALACMPPPVRPMSTLDARSIYHASQRIDEFPGGSYAGATPFMEGTSVLAGMKVARMKGLVESYRWAFSVEELIAGLSTGPAVLGIPWYSGMSTPDKEGIARIGGKTVGGHAICCRGVDLAREYFIFRQSWGRKFGHNGDCYITFKDTEQLLSMSGESCFPVKREPEPGFLNKLAMALGLRHR